MHCTHNHGLVSSCQIVCRRGWVALPRHVQQRANPENPSTTTSGERNLTPQPQASRATATSAIKARLHTTFFISKSSVLDSYAAGLLPCLISATRETCTRSEAARKASQHSCEESAKNPHSERQCRSLHHYIAHLHENGHTMRASPPSRPTRSACVPRMRP